MTATIAMKFDGAPNSPSLIEVPLEDGLHAAVDHGFAPGREGAPTERRYGVSIHLSIDQELRRSPVR
jgi:hypothetical protein